MTTSVDKSIASVTGFRIKKFSSTEGKNDKDSGTIQITLEAAADDINAIDYDLGDIVAAFNMHQRATEAIVLKIRFPDKD